MPPSRARKNFGDSGERVAALLLTQRGYKIIARNFRTRTGEMDLIAEDADGLAFVEVRARRGDGMTPEESLTPRKRKRLLAVAQEFLAAHSEFANHAWRIDLVALELNRAGRIARLDVLKGIVEE
jgi:putative endonuclease